jgi:hypothetical protein
VTYPGDGQGGWGGQGDWGQQSNYPPSGGFPQQQPHQPQQQYGGLGVFSGGPPEPPKKNKTTQWLIIGAVVLLVLVGGGVTAYLVTRTDDKQAVSTSTAPAPASSQQPTTGSSAPKPAACQPHAADWACLPVAQLSYSYDVPKTWKQTSTKAAIDGLPNVELTGISTFGVYNCGGKPYNRGSTGGVVVPQADLGATAKDIATKLSDQYYKPFAPTYSAAIGDPKPVTVPGTNVTGVQVDSVVTTGGNNCLATKGTIKILVLQGNKGLHVFMANGDLEGGPATPAPPTEADLQAMVASVKPLQAG